MSGHIDFHTAIKNKEAYFTRDEVQAILDYFYERGEYDRWLLFSALYYTGRRVSELLGMPPFSPNRKRSLTNYKGLRPCDLYPKLCKIDFEILKKAHIKQVTKTGTKRDKGTIDSLRRKKMPKKVLISVPRHLMDNLVAFTKQEGLESDERFFQVTSGRVRQWVDMAVKDKQIWAHASKNKTKAVYSPHLKQIVMRKSKPHPHMFRHSFAIHFLKHHDRNPAALPMLRKLLEHSNLQVTEHYLQFSDTESGKMLEEAFGGEE